jgi:Glycosyl hydrolases family 43
VRKVLKLPDNIQRMERSCSHEVAGSQPFPWLLAYFRQVYSHRVEETATGVEMIKLTDHPLLIEALHLAFTRDGLHWTPLNHNEPVLTLPPPFASLRDPFLQRGADGAYHLVGTGSGSRTGMTYTRSRDLMVWDAPRCLPVMDSVPGTKNVWAPEFIHDPASENYLLYWSSSLGRFGWDESRIWSARTPDFITFTQPRVLFDPGFSVIDATIVPQGGTYHMFFKDERFGHVYGERRSVRLATAPHLEGPYTVVTDSITPTITEGPAVCHLPDGTTWCLLYDYCMDNSYGVSLSNDLFTWRSVTDVQFPDNARHGSICPVTEGELQVLMEHYGM